MATILGKSVSLKTIKTTPTKPATKTVTATSSSLKSGSSLSSKNISVFLKPTTVEQIQKTPTTTTAFQQQLATLRQQDITRITPIMSLITGQGLTTREQILRAQSKVYAETGKGITPEGKVVGYESEQKPNIFTNIYNWLRRPVDTGIQEFLTRDVTLRDISKSVIGEAPPKTLFEEWGGLVKWGVIGLIAIAVITAFVKK